MNYLTWESLICRRAAAELPFGLLEIDPADLRGEIHQTDSLLGFKTARAELIATLLEWDSRFKNPYHGWNGHFAKVIDRIEKGIPCLGRIPLMAAELLWLAGAGHDVAHPGRIRCKTAQGRLLALPEL